MTQSPNGTTDLTRGIYRRQYSGYLKGRRINSISLEAEAWFWRVQSVVDDFGNIEADPDLVWLATKGRRKGVTVGQVSGWLREMLNARLITTYKARGDHYLHIVGFEEMQPAGKNGKRLRKMPEREGPGDSSAIQVNPDSSSASDNHTHNHSDNQNHTHSEDQKTSAPRAKRSAGDRGTRLPDDFEPSEGLNAWATKNAPHVDLASAVAEFRDYWRSVPGSRGRKLEWELVLKNRLRELEGRRNGNGRPAPKSKADLSVEAGKRVMAELEAEIERERTSV